MRQLELACGVLVGVTRVLAALSLLLVPIGTTTAIIDGVSQPPQRIMFLDRHSLGLALVLIAVFGILIVGVVIGAVAFALSGSPSARALLLVGTVLLALGASMLAAPITPAFLLSALFAIIASVVSFLPGFGAPSAA
jgi:hypothetical protein